MEFDRVVQEVIREARTYAGSGAALAEALQARGVGPESGRYSESGISNWVKGRTMPPANVLLAAAAMADLSLDRRIGATGANDAPATDEGDTGVRDELEELRRNYGRLETLLIDLYNRTGQRYPHLRATDKTRKKA